MNRSGAAIAVIQSVVTPLLVAPTGVRRRPNAWACRPMHAHSKRKEPKSGPIPKPPNASLASQNSSRRKRSVGNPANHIPAPQEHYRIAAEKAVETLKSQSPEQLELLGDEPDGDNWTIKVLGQKLTADIRTGSVKTPGGKEVGQAWRILVLHYLAIGSEPSFGACNLTFATISGAMTYDKVYQGRVIGRLCHTAGRDAETLIKAAVALDARESDGGDKAFEFPLFPKLSLKLIWYAADDEFPPSATILLPENLSAALSIEDIVVLSEQLVASLSGKPMD